MARRKEKLEETGTIIQKHSPDCKTTVCGGVDISDWKAVSKLFTDLNSSPDVVVSNAAVTLAQSDIATSDPELVAQEIDINVKGPYFIARAYAEAAKKSDKDGCLINVSSESSWRFIPKCSTYAMTKVSTNILTEHLQQEQATSGGRIRSVAMHPGGVITELGGMSSPDADFPDWIKKLLIDKPPLPGGTAVYLSTDRARYLMGRYVPAVADMEELEKLKDKIVEEDLFKERVLGWKGSL